MIVATPKIAIFLLTFTLIRAQAPPPKVGLVLSGGSALGLSHVGVLRWLEEHHIPIVSIAGTSMGGLVGGLYATGHSPDEIEAFVATIDWNAAFRPTSSFYQLAFRRKEDRREFSNSIEFGVKGGIRLPFGLSPGTEVGLLLSSFAAPYAEVTSFDTLPTPFRCVATDLITGTSVVFRGGSLPQALRSTMSLPGIFSPVSDGNRLLVDGALLNNLPVQVLKDELHPDIVVASALVDAPPKKNDITSLLGVAGRSLSLMIDSNEKKSMALADIVLAPDLTGTAPLQFEQYRELIRLGYEAAEKKKRLLETLSVSQPEWDFYIAGRKRKRRPEKIIPAFVQVAGIPKSQAASIQEKLEDTVVGRPLETSQIADDLSQVAGYGQYQSSSYGFIRRNGVDGVLVNIRPKPYGPPFISTGLNIEGSDTANIRFGFGARLTFVDFGAPGAEWRTDATIGLTNQISSEYYGKIRSSHWFLAPRAFYSQSRQDYYDNQKVRYAQADIHDGGFGADLGYSEGRFWEVRFGYQFDDESATISTGPALPTFGRALQTMRARWAVDTQDSALVPRRGVHATTELRWNFAVPSPASHFGSFEQTFNAARMWDSRYILVGTVNGGSILGPRFFLPAFTLGGPLNLSSVALGQLRGDRYYYGSATGLRAFSSDRADTFNRIYAAVAFEMGNAFTTFNRAAPLFDGAIGVAAETPVGVVFFGGSVGSQGNRKIFFRVGRLF